MGKRGPHPKPESELKRHRIAFRVTDAERKKIDKGRPDGMSRGEWCRHKVFSRKLPTPIPALNRKAWTKLSTAVANLNQISKSINQGLRSDLAEAELADLVDQVQAVRLRLLGIGGDEG